jgi:acyl dehydratase
MSDSQAAPLHFEDLPIGFRFATGEASVSTEDIKGFAASFDPQPFHLDESAARSSLFGELVASGWHTAAITMRLLVTSGLPVAGGVIGMGGELKWPRPVRPGDTLRVRGEVTAARQSASRPERGTVTITTETVNQREEVVQVMSATLVVPCRQPKTG